MKSFTYERPGTQAEAAAAVTRTPNAKFIAGGTNLLDLMKLQIETPTHLVDVNGLMLDKVEPTPEGGLRIGAGAQHRPRRRPAGAPGLRGLEPGAARRGLGAVAQQGDDRR